MTKFTWNTHGYVFHQGLSVLMTAYQKAADALREERERLKEEAVTYQQGVADGAVEWIGEREDGHILWDQEDVYEMEIEEALEAQNVLRKAFALSIYHHWERGAHRWTDNDTRSHAQLRKAVEELGVPISQRFDAVKDLANLLKHNNDDCAVALSKSWPELLSGVNVAEKHGIDWYIAVQLTDEHLTEACNIVGASGPNIKTVFIKKS